MAGGLKDFLSASKSRRGQICSCREAPSGLPHLPNLGEERLQGYNTIALGQGTIGKTAEGLKGVGGGPSVNRVGFKWHGSVQYSVKGGTCGSRLWFGRKGPVGNSGGCFGREKRSKRVGAGSEGKFFRLGGSPSKSRSLPDEIPKKNPQTHGQ